MEAEVHRCKTYPSLVVTQQGLQLTVGESAGSNKYLCAASMYRLESGLSFQCLEISCAISLGGIVCDSDEQRHGAYQQLACSHATVQGEMQSTARFSCGSMLLHCCSLKQC